MIDCCRVILFLGLICFATEDVLLNRQRPDKKRAYIIDMLGRAPDPVDPAICYFRRQLTCGRELPSWPDPRPSLPFLQEVVESAAEMLYGLIHARYILTSRGMQGMVSSVIRQINIFAPVQASCVYVPAKCTSLVDEVVGCVV